MSYKKQSQSFVLIADGEVAVREVTCTGDGVTRVGHHPSSSWPSLFPVLKRVEYPFTAG